MKFVLTKKCCQNIYIYIYIYIYDFHLIIMHINSVHNFDIGFILALPLEK